MHFGTKNLETSTVVNNEAIRHYQQQRKTYFTALRLSGNCDPRNLRLVCFVQQTDVIPAKDDKEQRYARTKYFDELSSSCYIII